MRARNWGADSFLPWVNGVAEHIGDPVARLRFLRVAAPCAPPRPRTLSRLRKFIPLLKLVLAALLIPAFAAVYVKFVKPPVTAVHAIAELDRKIAETSEEHPGAGPVMAPRLHQQQRGRNPRSPCPVRALAFKWIGVAFRCWKRRVLYDDAIYVASLRRRGSPLAALLDAAPYRERLPAHRKICKKLLTGPPQMAVAARPRNVGNTFNASRCT